MYAIRQDLITIAVLQMTIMMNIGVASTTGGITSCDSLIGSEGICPYGSFCFKVLENVIAQCQSYLRDDIECNKGCHRALNNTINKFPRIEGALKSCKCEKKGIGKPDYDCITARERFLRCKSGKKLSTVNSCYKMEVECRKGVKDKDCEKRYLNYFDSCTGLYQEGKCTTKCKLNYQKLLNNKFGKHFHKCTCDGTYDKERFCLEKTQLRKTLCQEV